MGMYYWADTDCSGKNAYVDEFVEVDSANVTVYTSALGSIYNLPIFHAMYAFDKEDGTVVLLEHINTIYMEYNMINSLNNLIQFEYNDVNIYLHSKVYYPNNNNRKFPNFPYGT